MTKFKLFIAVAMFGAIFAADVVTQVAIQPEVATTLALEQFANPSLATSTAQRAVEFDTVFTYMYLTAFLATGLLFYTQIKNYLSGCGYPTSRAMGLGLICLVAAAGGCRKPYHEKLYVDVGTSEIAILVETINDEGQAVVTPPAKGGVQKASGSQTDYYAKRVVNAKRVEIPYYWKQTSRVYLYDGANNGKWAPAARMLTINTAPEVREWYDGNSSGRAIWAESRDSVGFSTGISVTARIKDKQNALLFLSNYPPKARREVVTEGGDPFSVEVTSLKQIMDSELRTKIQEVFAYEAAAFTMDDLREKKREILDEIKTTVIPYFQERGITITSIGQFGGFTYENPKIQTSIDAVFQAQQDEEVAKAESMAAEQRKVALRLVGEGEADKAIEKANGEAEAVKLKAAAESDAIKLVADAKSYELEKLSENPEAYIQLKQLEIELQRVETWDGAYPQTLFGGGDSGAVPLLTIPGSSK